jgi:hypothetical protein
VKALISDGWALLADLELDEALFTGFTLDRSLSRFDAIGGGEEEILSDNRVIPAIQV